MAAMIDPMMPSLYRVKRKRREMRNTYTLDVEPANGDGDMSFAPGQFNMLYVFGIGEVPISISGDPTKNGSLVHTVRAVGAVSRAIVGLKRDDVLGLRGPFGTQWPVDEAHGDAVVIVAGGIGLAPLRPAIYQIIKHRERFGKVSLLYGARTPDDILYVKELERWQRQGIDVSVTVDRGTEVWAGNVGVVTRLISRMTFDRLNTTAMLCGPEIMMRFTIAELEKSGIDSDHIFVSMERNMKCAIGFCGHCQFGPNFICKDGPVFPYSRVENLLRQKEV